MENEGKVERKIGLRLLLDTLLGKSDGAPFIIPGIGELKYEQEFKKHQLPVPKLKIG